MRETRRDSEADAGARSARAPRAPRLLVENEIDAAPEISPSDIHIEWHECDDTHTEIWVSPAVRRDEGDDFSLADFEAGYRHFRMVGGPVTADLSSLRQQVAERHTRCHGTQDDCRRNKPSGLLLDGDPAVSFTVPTPVADAWANRVIETYRTHLDALTQRSA